VPTIATNMELLPGNRSITNEVYIFQQDNALPRRAHQTAEQWSCFLLKLLEFTAPDMWPPNSPDLSPVDY